MIEVGFGDVAEALSFDVDELDGHDLDDPYVTEDLDETVYYEDIVDGQFEDAPEQGDDCEVNHDEPAMFTPRLSVQRFDYVMALLRQHSSGDLESVLDLGCGELSAIKYLRHIDSVERIACVEIDKEELESRLFLIKPLISDYFSSNRRAKELVTQAYCGSILDRDSRLLNYQAAILVEVIEHLELEQLEPMAATLFGYYAPSIVVVTTPNADFNVLFKNFEGMRHWDHKFEWTRVEFVDWAYGIAGKYRYTVEIGGVGEDPDGNREHGCCTQVATFLKCVEYEDNKTVTCEVVPCEVYDKLSETTFPAREPVDESQRRSDVIFRVGHQARLANEQDPEMPYDLIDLIPLSEFMSNEAVCEFCTDEEELKEELIKADYRLNDEGTHVIVNLYDEDDEDDEALGRAGGDDEEEEGAMPEAEGAPEENWDVDGTTELWTSDNEENGGIQDDDGEEYEGHVIR